MDQSCCNPGNEDITIECHETEDGFNVVLKGDKEKIRAWCGPCCTDGSQNPCC